MKKYTIILAIVLLSFSIGWLIVEAAGSGPNYPSSGTNVTGIGTVAWTNPGNITADDAAVAVGNTSGSDTVINTTVQLVKAGSVTGSNLGGSGFPGISPGSYVSFGSSSNLWGTTWTPAEINATNFGVALSIKSSFGGSTTNYLVGSNYGFAIPTDATINGILVEIKEYYSGGNGEVGNVNTIRVTVTYTPNTPHAQATLTSGTATLTSGTWIIK